MLRNFVFAAVCLLVFAVGVSAQQFQEDVVYLKDGSVIRGVIVYQVSDEPLKIRIQGGSVLVIDRADVLNIVKEVPMQSPMVLKPEKDPAVAFMLSFLIIGTGQIYTEEYGQAFLHWLIAGACISLVYTGLEDNVRVLGVDFDPDDDDDAIIGGLLLGLTNWGISMISAPIAAQEMNKKNRATQSVTLMDDCLFLEPYSSRKVRGAMLSLRF